jgi:hypothetical protein
MTDILITVLHGRYFTMLHGQYRNVYYSAYLYNLSFKPTNALSGGITPAYNMPPTCCGPSWATIKEYQTQEEVTKTQ